MTIIITGCVLVIAFIIAIYAISKLIYKYVQEFNEDK